MSSNRRGLRSTKYTASPSTPYSPAFPSVNFTTSSDSASAPAVVRLVSPGSRLPGLTATESYLLRTKQSRLVSRVSSTLASLPPGPHIRNALEASLIFADHEAGSAVCIDNAGWVLTCAHCFGDTEGERRASKKRRWLLFYTGLAVQAECRAWDAKRDLALLKIIAVESSATGKREDGDVPTFHFVRLASRCPPVRTPIVCIGQPGSEDLESSDNQPTAYDLVEVSRGSFRGMVNNADPHDNSEIGTLKHDAWTYWGHSGAPLLREADGALLGLHSSWDDQTAMRHGVPLMAIKHFLQKQRRQLTGALSLSAVVEPNTLTGENTRAKVLQGKALTEEHESEEAESRIANGLHGSACRAIIAVSDD